MSQGSHVGQIQPPHLEMGTIAKQRIEEFAALQSGLFAKIQEANRSWFSLMQSEASLASELTTKLAAARSIPEATTAWQEWAGRSMQLNAENATHLLADGQKLMGDGSAPLLQWWLLQRSRREHLNFGARCVLTSEATSNTGPPLASAVIAMADLVDAVGRITRKRPVIERRGRAS